MTPGCAPTAETCNGVDDDCDGVVDNDIPPIPCPGGGFRYCVGGRMSDCPTRCAVCVPGGQRVCFISYCTYWGLQTCAADGQSWGYCVERRPVPRACAGVASDKKHSRETEQCCIGNGFCCLDEFDLNGNGDTSEMLGRPTRRHPASTGRRVRSGPGTPDPEPDRSLTAGEQLHHPLAGATRHHLGRQGPGPQGHIRHRRRARQTPPSFAGATKVAWDWTRENDDCTDKIEDCLSFDVSLADASDDGGRDARLAAGLAWAIGKRTDLIFDLAAMAWVTRKEMLPS